MSAQAKTTSSSSVNLQDYQGGQLLATCIIFIIFDVLFVALRVCSRQLAVTTRGWDDYLIPPALIMNLAIAAIGLMGVKIAYTGWHIAAVPVDILPTVLKITFAMEWIYPTAVMLPKLSIVCLYLRIFTSKAAQISSYVIMAVLLSTWLAFVVAATVQCQPVAYAWDKRIPNGSCINLPAYYRASNVPNTVTDLAMLILPMPTIWHLRISKIRRLGLTMIFVSGGMYALALPLYTKLRLTSFAPSGIVGSCVRIYSLTQISTFENADDVTWNSTSLTIWTVTEPSMYLIAACLISLRPLFVHLAPRWNRSRLYGHDNRSCDPSRPARILNGDFKRPLRINSDPSSITRFVSQVQHSNHVPSDEALAKEYPHGSVPLREINVRTDIEVEYISAQFSNLV